MNVTESKEALPEHVDEKGAAPDFNDTKFLSEEAAQATAAEHSLGLWQALKTYKRAAFWSVRKSTTTNIKTMSTFPKCKHSTNTALPM